MLIVLLLFDSSNFLLEHKLLKNAGQTNAIIVRLSADKCYGYATVEYKVNGIKYVRNIQYLTKEERKNRMATVYYDKNTPYKVASANAIYYHKKAIIIESTSLILFSFATIRARKQRIKNKKENI